MRFKPKIVLSAAMLAAVLGWGMPAVAQKDGVTAGGKQSLARTKEATQPKLAPATASALRNATKQPQEHAAVAQSCLAIASVMRQSGDSAGLKGSLIQVADLLVKQKDLNADGRVGWGVPATREKHKKCPSTGMLDAFGDGSCNPPDTEYTFQTGLATMCLAQAYELTRDARYRETAERALNDSWDIGRKPAACSDCFYYWYSYDANDNDRYVRNTNVLMGAAAAWVWKISGNTKYKERATQIAKSELRELAAKNDGYFGIDDRRYKEAPDREAKRIENHVPWVAKGLADIGAILADSKVKSAAIQVQDSWQFCSGAFTCKSDCDIWAADSSRCINSVTASPCFHKNASDRYAALCEAAVRRIERNPNSYQLWAITTD